MLCRSDQRFAEAYFPPREFMGGNKAAEQQLPQVIMDQINFIQNLMLQKIQEMEEKRIVKIGKSLKKYAELDQEVIPIIGKCLDGIVKAADSIDQKNVSIIVWT